MNLHNLFSLPHFSFSIVATSQHFMKWLESMALKISGNLYERQISKAI